MDFSPVAHLVSFALVVWLLARVYRFGSRERGLPPGPPTLPVIGNLHVFPSTRAYLKFTEWARVHGDICSVKLGSQTVVILSSPRAVQECIENDSAVTSNRPAFYVSQVLYRGKHVALAEYGSHWRDMRRATHHLLSKEASRAHIPIQQAEATLMLCNILEDPQNIYAHIRRYSTSVALSVVFGIHCASHDDPIISDFYQCADDLDDLVRPGGHPPIDIFPFLKYVPERWAPWKELCRRLISNHQRYYSDLVNRCLARIARDHRNGSFIEYLLEDGGEYGFDREEIRILAGSLLDASADSTGVSLQLFVFCMLQNPDALAKAQREIDDVVGYDRVPQLRDIESLPYVRAMIKEVYRYTPVTPTCIPHAATTKTTVRGYLIPEGTIIFTNVWGINRDEDLFEDPDRFWPERFIGSEYGTKPGADTTGCREIPFTFGGGRRLCPGIHLAENSVALNVMNLLWAFDFSLPKDPDTGHPIPIDMSDTSEGVLLTPKPFSCEVRPRSAAKVECINLQFESLRPIFDRFERTEKKM